MLLSIITGKSSAIQYAAQDLLEHLDLIASIINKTRSSGLTKLLATQRKGFLLSPEVFDVLNKLMKSDEDNATGDIQLLCKLFSGEQSSFNYSTEESRIIQVNTPISILGSTQLLNATKLIAKMDQGHGLIDSMLITTPLALRPTLTEMESAKQQLETEVVEDFAECFKNITDISLQIRFHFSDEAQQLLRDNTDQFVTEVNDAIREGKVPLKSKLPELVPRIATALHVFSHAMTELLVGVPPTSPSAEIQKSTLERAVDFVHHLESQKSILCHVSYTSHIYEQFILHL